VEWICQPIRQWVAFASVTIETVVMTSTPSLRVIPEPVSVKQALYLMQMQRYKIKLKYSRLIAALIYSFITFWCLVFHCERTCWLCGQLGSLASIIMDTHSSMSTAFCRHHLNFISCIFSSKSSIHLNPGLPLLLLHYVSLSNIFFLISASMSKSSYSSLNS
jgi:hypothetical protein